MEKTKTTHQQFRIVFLIYATANIFGNNPVHYVKLSYGHRTLQRSMI